jgi:hypothetical protein
MRRHRGRAIRAACGFGRDYIASAELAGFGGRGDGWASVILRCEQVVVLAGRVFMLCLHCQRGLVRLAFGGLFPRRGPRHNTAGAAVVSLRF